MKRKKNGQGMIDMEFKSLKECFPETSSPLIIAGPCSAETEKQVMETATLLAKIPQVKIFRAGIWKPRTRPNTFEGVGEKGLFWLQRVKRELGLMTATEVANTKHVEQALKHGIDVLWIGARTTVSPFAVQEIADALRGVNIPIMIKNPIHPELSLWMGAIERIHQAGIDKIVAIHRGFSSDNVHNYRNAPLWKVPIELKSKMPTLPLICDPSHIAGKRDLIANITQKALDVGMDGAMIETHITPELAWSDAAQQITPQKLNTLYKNLSFKRPQSSNQEFKDELEFLREKIDRADRELIELLGQRQKIVTKIATAKIKNEVTALQVDRLNEMMAKRYEIGKSYGLPQNYIKDIYTTIHEESVKQQTDIMKQAEDLEKRPREENELKIIRSDQ